MIRSFKIFFQYFLDSLDELFSNFKIYLIYIFALCLVSIVQNGFDLIFSQEQTFIRIVSKILFSLIPLLILSKILYVIKIRNSGIGEYRNVLWRFLLYNFYYFFLVLTAVGVCFIFASVFGTLINVKMGILAGVILLLPLFYIMIFYSLSPLVAVFDDDNKSAVLKQSKILSQRDILTVIVNHLVSLMIPALFSFVMLVNNQKLKFFLGLALSVPEAIFSIIMILTTTRIYNYLLNKE